MKTGLLALALAATLTAQPRLPDEAAGLDAIVRTLLSAFDQSDIVALGEWHGLIPLDSDLRIALVRHPDFAKKVRSIVVEFASTTEQPTLDRYIRGENVSKARLEQVWKTTTQAVTKSASSAVTPVRTTIEAAKPPPSPYSKSRCFKSTARR
jgi:hypothetical protein